MSSDREMTETQRDAFLFSLLAQLEQVLAEAETSYDVADGLQRFTKWLKHNSEEDGKTAEMAGGPPLRSARSSLPVGSEWQREAGPGGAAGQVGLAAVALARPSAEPQLTSPPGSHGPTVLRILLGAQLRQLREARQITMDDAGNVTRMSASKISRLEAGRGRFRDRDISDLLTLYSVTDERERNTLRRMARDANDRGWWHDYADILPNWFEAYVGLEEAATSIRGYEIQFVPGLLETEDYARAVTLLGHPNAPAEEIERRVSLRMTRQTLLARPQPPHLSAVLDEAILRRPVGQPGVMRAQLKHLLEATERSNVMIQIIPFQADRYAAAGGPFSILQFAEFDLPDVVYVEQLTSAIYLDKRETVEHYLAVMDRLYLAAEPPDRTTQIISRILNEL